MGVQAYDGAVPVLHVPAAVFYLVGVGIGGAHLHGVGQVYNDPVLRRGPQLLQDPVADEHGIVHLRAGEALRGVFISDVNVGIRGYLLGELSDKPGAVYGNVYDPLHIRVEHHPAL